MPSRKEKRTSLAERMEQKHQVIPKSGGNALKLQSEVVSDERLADAPQLARRGTY